MDRLDAERIAYRSMVSAVETALTGETDTELILAYMGYRKALDDHYAPARDAIANRDSKPQDIAGRLEAMRGALR
jgi:hypothetical protein